jgi:tetratricopeptide (TPR) repeat protein
VFQGFYFRRVGRIDEGKRLSLESLSVLSAVDARMEKAYANMFLHSHGSVYSPEIIEDYTEMKALLDESLSTFREIHYERGIAQSLNTLGNVARDHQDYDQARAYYRQALEFARSVNAPRDMGWALIGLAWVARDEGKYGEARDYILENQAVANETGPRLSWHLSELGRIEYLLGNYEAAMRAFYEVLKITVDKLYLGWQSLDVLLWLCRLWAQDDRSEWIVEVLTLIREHPATLPETREEAARCLTELESQLAPESFTAAVERGQLLEIEVVVRDILINLED